MNLWISYIPLQASARWVGEDRADEWELDVLEPRPLDGGNLEVLVAGRLRYTERKHEVRVQSALVSRPVSREEFEAFGPGELADSAEALLYAHCRGIAVAAAGALAEGINPPSEAPERFTR